MTIKQVEIYYYLDENTRTVFWSETESEIDYLEFLGSSMNPNKRMAVARMTQKSLVPSGYTIKPLP